MRRPLVCALSALLLTGLVPAAGVADPGHGRGDRFLPRPAGVEKPMTFSFGPFLIPPGQDFNRVTLDVPAHGGFFTAIRPRLVEAATGEEPSHQVGHIHHAHWFRASTDPQDDEYTAGLSWVFGTGEETTGGSLDERAAAEPGGPRYGIYIPGGEPQTLIYMLHNKSSAPQLWFVELDVRFVYGSAAEIRAAEGCGPVLLDGETCAAGDSFNQLRGILWGQTFDVPRQPGGDGEFVHPRDRGRPNGIVYTANWDATLVAAGGHLHPNGKEVVIANLGPAGSGCEADLDGDGYAGVTLFRSRKIERVAAAWPHSEDYQMGVTKYGFRAPIRTGDRIAQYGVYDNDDYASYEAMSYTGIYVDKAQKPEPVASCSVQSLSPYLVDDPAGDPTETIPNREWHHEADALCGLSGYPACDRPEPDRGPGMETDTVHVAGFLYLPGDRALGGQLGAPPRVKQGTPLRFVNEDVAAGIRHSVTSCPWPCNGTYVANYPQPDGTFDSGRMGNLDPIDGGLTGDDTSPEWQAPANLPAGKYAYYCRIHPWMRGAFEVVA